MKWTPFGKDAYSYIESFRDGCASQPCVHLHLDIACDTIEARRVIKDIVRAIKYAEGRKRIYKDKSHNWRLKHV